MILQFQYDSNFRHQSGALDIVTETMILLYISNLNYSICVELCKKRGGSGGEEPFLKRGTVNIPTPVASPSTSGTRGGGASPARPS